VESLCQKDPEDLARQLAAKGAVSAALEVAENYNLRDEYCRELQGQKLVELLKSDPVNGGGPAEALRFLMSLQTPEDSLLVAMDALKQLPSLHSKQLLVVKDFY
jgi:zinc finger FYVE domain-containing protein 26